MTFSLHPLTNDTTKYPHLRWQTNNANTSADQSGDAAMAT